MAFVCTSGWMMTEVDEFAIIKPLVDATGKKLRTWKPGEGMQEHEVGDGLNIIAPGLNYTWPSDVPFTPLFAHSN